MEASSKRCCTSCRPCRFSVRGNIKAGNFRDDSVLACALLLTVPCQRFTPKQHPFFPQSRTHSPLHPEPAALHCPFKALVGQHQGLSHQYCPTAVGTPSHGHFPGPLLFVEEFQCFADSKKIKQREDGMFPSCRQRTWSFTLELFYFLWGLREMHSLLFCNCLPVPDCDGTVSTRSHL